MESPQNNYNPTFMAVYALLSWVGTGATVMLSYADFAMKFISFCFTITVSIFAIRYYMKSLKKLDK